MAFIDVPAMVEKLRSKAQDMLDSSQVDDRVAHVVFDIADFLADLGGKIEQADTDETDDKGEPERTSTDPTDEV